MPRPPTTKKKNTRCLRHGKNNKAPSQTLETPTSVPPVVPVPEQPSVDDSYLSMNVSQLRRKVKALIGLKKKNKKTIDDLKKERDDLGKEKKKYKKDMLNHNCELRDLSESHKNQISAIRDVHAEDIAKKDAVIHDFSVKLQELRQTTNIVRYKCIIIKYIWIQVIYHYLLLNYYFYSYLLS